MMVSCVQDQDVGSKNTKQNKETMMNEKKRYEVKGKCPQCAVEEIDAKTIDKENIELSCPECGQVHREQVKAACPEYAKECHL
jgi:transcription elongation factor Elf1